MKTENLKSILKINSSCPAVLLAPMADVTGTAERKIAEDFGADVTFPAMISGAALFRGVDAAVNLIQPSPSNKLNTVQLIGKDPHEMEFSAAYAMDKGVELIDINMGCPMKDIVRNGQGAALLKTPDLAYEIIKAVRRGVKDNIPVSVKTRIGWDFNSVNIESFAKMTEKAGAVFLTVHGRTRSQLYSGKSNPDLIKKAVEAVSIPVIANGDIKTSSDAGYLLEYTGAAGVMVARGSYGNPWIFSDIKNLLIKGKEPHNPSLKEKLKVLKHHIDLIVRYAFAENTEPGKTEEEVLREKAVLVAIKKQMSWYSKGMPDAADFRNSVFKSSSYQELIDLLEVMNQKLQNV